MSQSRESRNKAFVIEAFDTLFHKRDYVAAERFWSTNYVQHSAHIEPGREGLFNLIKGSPASLKYEPGVIVAEGDFVIVHGRFSGAGLPRNWIAADVVRIADGVLAEHWDASRTRRLALSQRAVCRCSATASPIDRGNPLRRFLDAQVPLPSSEGCRSWPTS
jgi:predicted SnoaL-like aldol condensation-catalyzing enzyme